MAACCSEIKSCQVEKGEEESPGKSVKGKQFSDQAGSEFSGKIHPQRCSNEGNTNVMFCLVFLYICCRLLMEYEEHLFKFHLKIKKSTSFYFSYISSFFYLSISLLQAADGV